MKPLFFQPVPKLAQNLTGGGKSPQLVDNSTLVDSLGLLNPCRWLPKRSIQRPRVQLPACGLFLILSLFSLSAHAGIISTVAGTGTAGFSGDGGAATSAQLNYPEGIAVDSSGNLYIADTSNHRLRKITPGGIISTVAGTGTAGFSGDGGLATSAKLNYPTGVAVDSSGNLYIADFYNDRLRKVTPGGIISTVAGDGIAGYSGDGGTATSAKLNYPEGIAVDSSDNLYIADLSNHRIRKVTTGGIISTVAGTGTQGYSGDGGAATSAKLNNPQDITVDSSDNLYIAEQYNYRVRKVTSGGIISTVAGTGTMGYSGDGGAATSAKIDEPYGVAVDSSGNLYIVDTYNSRVRKVTPGGVISTVAGNGTQGYSGDGGAATSAQLNYPYGVAVDSSGNLYIADYKNHRLRKVTVVPIMNVQSNSTSIASGDTTPTTTDNTDFGSTPVGTPVSKTFTIANTGEGILNLTGSPKVSVTGSGFSVTTQPTSPVAATTGTTNFVIQFLPTASGVSNGTVSIANNDSLHNPYTFSITGTGTNTAPVANNSSLTTNEDTAGSGTVTASDANGDSLTYSLVTNGSKGSATITASTGAYTYTPNLNQNGTDTFTFKANDGIVDSNIATITVTITPVNDAPVITQGASIAVTMSEDGSPTAWSTPTITATDVDSGTLTWSLNTAALHGTATVSGTGASPSITYVPTTNYNGSDSFVVKVSDGSLTATITVNVTITAVNDAPVASNGTLTTNENIAGSGTLSASDVEANSLTYSIVANGSKGTATITNASTGAYTYTPNLNQNGSDTFTFKVNDGTVNSNTATLTVTITPVNDAPVITQGASTSATMSEDGSPTAWSTPTITATDVDGDTLTWSLNTAALHGTATVSGTGASPSITYVPTSNYNGSDSFVVKVSDGSLTATITVNVTITAVNDAPVATAGTLTTNEDTVGSGTLTASDLDANPLTYSVVTNGSKGTANITNASTGAYTYTPNLNQNGSDTFTFKVNDGTADSNIATMTVTITAVNDPPTLTTFSATLDTTAEDTEVELTFAELTTQGDESDSADAINSGSVTSFIVQAISTGTLKLGANAGAATAYAAGTNETIDATHLAYWTPVLNANGTLNAFTVKAKDNSGALSSTAVQTQVIVTAVNDAPVATAGTLTTNEDTVGSGTLTASDLDANPLTYSVVTNGSKGTANITNASTGAYTYTPNLNQNGSDTFTFKVNDGTVDSNIATMTVTITAVNDIPTLTVFSSAVDTTNEDTQVELTFAELTTQGDESDSADAINSGSVTSFIVQAISTGTLKLGANAGAATAYAAGTNETIDATHLAYWTPVLNANGTLNAFTVKAKDNSGALSSTAVPVPVTVTAVNDAPIITGQNPLSTNEDTALTLTFANVLVTDLDNIYPTGFTLTVQTGSNYTVSGTTLTPAANFNGTLTVPVKVNDGGLDSNIYNLTVTVIPVNDAPIITGQTPLSTNEDTALILTLTNEIVTDIDNTYPTGFTLTVQTGGNYTVSGTTLTPVANFNGTLTVPVKVNDGGLDSNLYNLTVTVNAVNDVPVATPSTLTTLEDTVGNGVVAGTDIENSPLTYTVVTNSTQGTVVITNASTGAYTYTPNTNLNGSDSFTFKANDGTVDSPPATVTVTLTPVNDLPTFTASNPPAVLENTGTHTLPNWATFTAGPVDETDSVLVYNVSNVSNPTLFAALPTVNTSGTLTYTLATNQSGTSTIDVTVQDTGGTANGGNDLSTVTQFTLQTNAPELQVQQGTTVQANGSVYDFGLILITQSSPTITFTLDNLGTSDLFLTGTPKLAITGEAAAEFLVTHPTLDTLIPGALTTFTVTFIPTVMGVRTATLTLANNDSDETTNTLLLQGQGLTPNVRVSLGSTEIPMGGALDLGLVSVGHLVSYPLTIENVGNSDLRLLGDPSITVNGVDAVDFNIDETATTTVIQAGEHTSFVLNFQPFQVGPKTVTVIVSNNDLEQGTYAFTVTAAGGLQKDLQVTFAGTGQGVVTSNLPNLTCVAEFCLQPVIDAPQWVRLKPIPAEGSAFTGWSGDPICQADGKVFVTDNTICQATFELQSYEFTVGRFGNGRVTGPGIDCPSDCTETLLYGTDIQLEAVADREWTHTGWKGSCDATGKVKVANAKGCHAIFEALLEGPNVGDGNGDGVVDAKQPHVISLPDQVSGQYVTFEVQPETCPITDIYTDVPDNYGKPDKNKPLPQGLIYFELGCPQAQISVYYHAVNVVRRNLVFRKFGPTVPGDESTVGWFNLPNVTFEAVPVGTQTVVKATYTVTDGQLGDSTGVDGRIVDPGGLGLQ